MAEAEPEEDPDARPPLIVRTAEWLGRALGKWRRGRLEKRDDAYILAWKAAWVQGCESRWHGHAREDVPHRSGAEHDAWLAGWAWADTQPDRRDAARLVSRAHPRRRASDSGTNNSSAQRNQL